MTQNSQIKHGSPLRTKRYIESFIRQYKTLEIKLTSSVSENIKESVKWSALKHRALQLYNHDSIMASWELRNMLKTQSHLKLKVKEDETVIRSIGTRITHTLISTDLLHYS